LISDVGLILLICAFLDSLPYFYPSQAPLLTPFPLLKEDIQGLGM
jgi:hypothetical protein